MTSKLTDIDHARGTKTTPEVTDKRLPEGRGRLTGRTDREHVVRWCRKFCVDVGEQPSIDLIDAGSWDDSRFGDRHFTFWETPDGTPVSMAAATAVIGGMVRIDPVYTPAHLRGRSYAGAATAFLDHLTQRGRTLAECTQADVDAWYAGNYIARRLTHTFLRWAMRSKHMPKAALPHRSTSNPAPLAHHQRLALLRQLVNRDDVPLHSPGRC
jgi:hypothetical protein